MRNREICVALIVVNLCLLVWLHDEPEQVAQASQQSQSEVTNYIEVEQASLSSQASQPTQPTQPEQVEQAEKAEQTEQRTVSEYVLRVVAAESRSEPFEGQMAVAQCIKTTSETFGMTPEEVVSVRNQYAKPVAESLVTDSVREACKRVFIDGEYATEEPIQYFYSTKGGFVSKWHERRLKFVTQIGNHKFFKR